MKPLKFLLIIITLIFVSNATAQTVYITDTGKKYHKSDCRYLKHSKNKITLEKAQARGYIACKVCKPNASLTSTKKKSSATSTTTAKNNTSPSSTATRCTGTTKSGSRCKRKTKSSSGRCYQH